MAEVPFVTKSCLAVVLWHVSCFSASLCDVADLLPSISLHATDSSWYVCGYTGCTYCFFHFPHSCLFSCPCLFLFALDRLRASVCIPKQLRDAAANKEGYCLSLKKGQPSLEVFPWMICHTFELLVQRRRPFIPHPRGERKSATKGCRVSGAQEKLGTKSIAH